MIVYMFRIIVAIVIAIIVIIAIVVTMRRIINVIVTRIIFLNVIDLIPYCINVSFYSRNIFFCGVFT